MIDAPCTISQMSHRPYDSQPYVFGKSSDFCAYFWAYLENVQKVVFIIGDFPLCYCFNDVPRVPINYKLYT